MSAVAVAPATHLAVAAPLHGAAHAPTHEIEAAEQQRWLLWFGVPALVAALFVGLVFATGQEWLLGLGIGSIVFDIGVLVWLALSSDTNGLLGSAPSHH